MTPRPKTRPGQKTETQKMRETTDYDKARYSGYAAYANAMAADGWRITGLAGGRVLQFLVHKATGRRVGKDEPFSETTEPLKVSQMVELLYLDERTVQRELKDLIARKIVTRTEVKKGTYEFTLLSRTWYAIPDYVPVPVEQPADESDDEPIEDDPAQNKEQTITKLTESPVRIAAGKKSKPVKVECGVSALQFIANVDAECSAVVKGGVLLVNLKYEESRKLGNGRSNDSNDLSSSPRHPSRDEPKTVRGKQTKGERRSESENVSQLHPRAAELCSLFDPLILKWCGKTLSGDSQALLKACSAIGDTPGDVLVSELMKERAGREIKPLHVAAICKEIEHNWRAGGTLPTPKLPGSVSSSGRQTFADRLKARAIENIRKTGRIA